MAGVKGKPPGAGEVANGAVGADPTVIERGVVTGWKAEASLRVLPVGAPAAGVEVEVGAAWDCLANIAALAATEVGGIGSLEEAAAAGGATPVCSLSTCCFSSFSSFVPTSLDEPSGSILSTEGLISLSVVALFV